MVLNAGGNMFTFVVAVVVLLLETENMNSRLYILCLCFFIDLETSLCVAECSAHLTPTIAGIFPQG